MNKARFMRPGVDATAPKPDHAVRLLARILGEQGGFLKPGQVRELKDLARFTPLLVRCGGCRFTASAQDVEHLVAIITAEGSDYVRDVSLPAS